MKLTGDVSRFIPTKVYQPVNESIQLAEGHAPVKGLLRVRGIFQRYDVTNANGRKYTKDLFERVFKDPNIIESFKAPYSMLGLLEHPEDGLTKLDRIPSHVVLWAKDNGDGTIIGEALILNTSTGRDLAGIFEGGCSVGISSRGDGELVMQEGIQLVKPDTFKLITWDFVFDNSVPGARPAVVPESVQPSPQAAPPLLENMNNPAFKKLAVRVQATKKPGFSKDGPAARQELMDYCHKNKIDLESPEVQELLGESQAKPGAAGIAETPEYLSKPLLTRKSMSKLSEMRKLDLELSRIIPDKSKKLPFSTKVALSEEFSEYRSKIETIIAEDASTKSLGDRLLKRLQEAEDEFDAPAEEAPPATAPAVTPPAPGAEGAIPGETEIKFDVSQEDFCTVFCEVVKQFCPDCDEPKLKQLASEKFDSFTKGELSGVQEAVNELMAPPAEGDGAPATGAGGEDLSGGGTEIPAEAAPVDKQLESALALIKGLSGQLQESKDAQKVQEFKDLLVEARDELLKSKGNDERLSRNTALLREARDEIVRLRATSTEKTSILEAAVALLKKHNITDAALLRRVEETSSAPATAPAAPAAPVVPATVAEAAPAAPAVAECDADKEAAAKKKKEDEEAAEKAKVKAEEGVQPPAAPAAPASTPVNESAVAKPEPHDVLRVIQRNRKGPWNQFGPKS
jgi:hypothetical protein